MIKAGQVREWRRKSDYQNKVVITYIEEKRCYCVENDGCFFMSSTDWLSKHYKTIAEYPTWQEAVNSKEFKG